MKILFLMRHDYLEKRGGDTYQLIKTKEFLEKKGVEVFVDTSCDGLIKYKDVDLVHIFNIQLIDLTTKFVNACNELNMTTVLSPIYWDLTYSTYTGIFFKLFSNYKLYKLLSIHAPFVKNYNHLEFYLSPIYKKKMRHILNSIDLLLPNSNEEGDIINKHFNVQRKYISIPNSVEKVQICDNPEKDDDIVLQVGRIEPVKNQLGVVRALMHNPNIRIIFIGRRNMNFKKYLNELDHLSQKRGNVTFIDELPQNELAQYYYKAKVHVLPSLRESPGLVSLEALQYKCNVVVSSNKYCPVKYYKFNKYAFICDPFDNESIRQEILKALESPFTMSAAQFDDYFDFYSYENATKMTYDAYKLLLEDNVDK